MNISASKTHPHRRYNPLKDEWVLVSPHRNNRPWQGRKETVSSVSKPTHDPDCYLCSGNIRVNGNINPNYKGPYVFENDFPALLKEEGMSDLKSSDLLKSESVKGTARVICFSDRHDLTLPEMGVSAIRQVVDLWSQQSSELGREYKWVSVFENKGELMGCSNPHPHGQIWAMNFIPNEIDRENNCLKKYFESNSKNLLLEYARLEIQKQVRVVVQNDHWIAIVPFWAIWPYEILLLPKTHVLRLPDLSIMQRHALAEILKSLLTRYDNLFNTEFPYSMGWHGAPFVAGDHDHWQLHAHFYPPLLRSATIRKFMVGYEMLAEAQRDITPETAAEQLRALKDTHYKETSHARK